MKQEDLIYAMTVSILYSREWKDIQCFTTNFQEKKVSHQL